MPEEKVLPKDRIASSFKNLARFPRKLILRPKNSGLPSPASTMHWNVSTSEFQHGIALLAAKITKLAITGIETLVIPR